MESLKIVGKDKDKSLVLISKDAPIAKINAFEKIISSHVAALNFVPDMTTKESREKSKLVLKEARKTFTQVDELGLKLKKEAEVVGKAIQEVRNEKKAILKEAYLPHKAALDDYRDIEKKAEAEREALLDVALEWLTDIAMGIIDYSIDELDFILSELAAKDLDNTGIDLSHDQKMVYGKRHMLLFPKVEKAKEHRIIQDVRDMEMMDAVIEQAKKDEANRVETERLQKIENDLRIKDKAEKLAKDKIENLEIIRINRVTESFNNTMSSILHEKDDHGLSLDGVNRSIERLGNIDTDLDYHGEEKHNRLVYARDEVAKFLQLKQIEAKEKEAANKIEAEAFQEKLKELAAKNERKRIEGEAANARRIAEARAQDVEVRRKANQIAVIEIMAECKNSGIEISEEAVKAIVKGLATGSFTNISISY